MERIYVQFFDQTEEEVVALLGGVGDPEVYRHQGVVQSNDPRYDAFLDKIDAYARSRLWMIQPAGPDAAP
ncbi:hypothetical protein PAQ31011_00848 [Pandoraea aquatica]|uniref:Uncharacterized protein n=1 Tax=Pandoraea aquatica TaxID=2508290 RepID=A0A5E4SKZ9_9BURK|nr:hypothetical protein [Pandoraea aquatica]VVD75492.1 hypothetical protein PAQ31011_00848 [Pandoraea aquatica]